MVIQAVTMTCLILGAHFNQYSNEEQLVNDLFTVFNMNKGRDHKVLSVPFMCCIYVVNTISLGIPSFPNFAYVK